MASGMASVRRAVQDLLAETDRGALGDDALLSEVRNLLSSDARVGGQRELAYHTPRRSTPRMADLMENQEVRRRMLDTIERGVEAGGDTFYDTRPMRAMFEEATTDPNAFSEFVGVNAAFSPQARVPEQVRRAIVAYGAHKRGEGVPLVMPDGYSHFLHRSNHYRLANNVLSGKGLDPLTGAKTASFRENLMGNLHPDVATIDKHATSLPAIMSGDPRWLKSGSEPVQYRDEDFVPRHAFQAGDIDIDDALEQPNWWGGKPLASEYRDFVAFYRNLGEEAGLPNTAAAQAAAWRGGDDITGVESPNESLSEVFVRRVLELARKHGMSFRETLTTVARGDKQLLSVAAGSPLLLGLLGEESDAA